MSETPGLDMSKMEHFEMFVSVKTDYQDSVPSPLSRTFLKKYYYLALVFVNIFLLYFVFELCF